MMHDWAVPSMSSQGTMCAGHEGAGVIVKVGEQVKTLKVGQRAGIKPISDTCGTCDQCKSGRDNYCPKGVLTGLHVDGINSSLVPTPPPFFLLLVLQSIMLKRLNSPVQ